MDLFPRPLLGLPLALAFGFEAFRGVLAALAEGTSTSWVGDASPDASGLAPLVGIDSSAPGVDSVVDRFLLVDALAFEAFDLDFAAAFACAFAFALAFALAFVAALGFAPFAFGFPFLGGLPLFTGPAPSLACFAWSAGEMQGSLSTASGFLLAPLASCS